MKRFFIFSYVNEFTKKLTAIHQDNETVKDYVKNGMDVMFGTIVKSIEGSTGKKASENCELPAVTSVDSEYKSLLIPMMKAIQNLDK